MSQNHAPDKPHPDVDQDTTEAVQANRVMKQRLEGEMGEDERPKISIAQEMLRGDGPYASGNYSGPTG